MNEKFLGRFSSKWPESLAMRELRKSLDFEATRNLGFVEEEVTITNVPSSHVIVRMQYAALHQLSFWLCFKLHVIKLFEAFS